MSLLDKHAHLINYGTISSVLCFNLLLKILNAGKHLDSHQMGEDYFMRAKELVNKIESDNMTDKC